MLRTWCRVLERGSVLHHVCRHQSTHAEVVGPRPLQSLSRLSFLQHVANNNNNNKTKPEQPPPQDALISGLERLHLHPTTLQPLTLRPAQNIHPTEYKLPSVIKNITKRTILDPVKDQRRYDLPTLVIPGTEKFTPTPQIVPIEDPGLHPLLPVIEKETMPYLVNIRKRKMKKHKLKKFRKRMIFLHRKLREIKLKRKEQTLQTFERSFATAAQEFDAETHVAGHIKEAKRGGWKIDVIQKWQSSKTGDQTPTESSR